MRIYLLLIYLAIMNIAGIIVMAADKKKAKKHTWRIPERTLFLVSILEEVLEPGRGCIFLDIRQSIGTLLWECH